MEILVTVCVIALVLLLLYVLTRRQPRDAISVPDVGGGPNVGWSLDGGSGSCSSGGDGGGGGCGSGSG